MSEDMNYRGRLVPVDLGDLTIEEKAKELANGVELEDYYDSYLERLTDEESDSKRYLYHDKTRRLFLIEDLELRQSSTFVDVKAEENGSYTFNTQFYNGGTYLEEMLNDGLDSVS